MPSGLPGALGGYLDTDLAMTQLSGERLSQQMNQFELQTKIKNQAILDNARAQMMDEARRQLASGGMGVPVGDGGPAMGMVGPTPQSLAAGEAANSGQPAEIGDALPGAGAPVAVAPKIKQSDLLMGQYNNAKKMATIARSAGDTASALAFDKEANGLLEHATTAKTEDRKNEEQGYDNMLNYLNGIVDKQSLNTVVAAARARYPEIKQMLDQSGMVKGPDGQYLWEGTQNPKIIQTLGEMAVSAKDRIGRENKEEQARMRQQQIDETAEHHRETEAAQRTNQVIAQNGQELRADIAKAQAAERKTAFTLKATMGVQRQMDADPVYGNFTKYEQARDLGAQVKRQLSTPEGYANFNASDARALGNTFSNIAEGFRSRTGGRYAIQDQATYNGLLQKYDKWVSSFGKGTPAFSESTSRDITNTVTQLYDIANKAAVTTSLEGMDLAQRRGGDPDAIKFKGDLNRLVAIGQAKKVTTNGKTFLLIGKPGETQHKFEVADEEQ